MRKRPLKYVEKVHAAVYGENEQQFEKLIEYLSGMGLFSEKPKDIIRW